MLNPDSAFDDSFPAPLVETSDFLRPIRSWSEMYREIGVTGVEFDFFWYENARDGVTQFFRWVGEPRATVLVVVNDGRPLYIECRKGNDLQLTSDESLPIFLELWRMFEAKGQADVQG